MSHEREWAIIANIAERARILTEKIKLTGVTRRSLVTSRNSF